MYVLIVIIFKFGGISNNEQIDLYNKCHGEKMKEGQKRALGREGCNFR